MNQARKQEDGAAEPKQDVGRVYRVARTAEPVSLRVKPTVIHEIRATSRGQLRGRRGSGTKMAR